MKVLVFIMSLMVLGLSCLPCADETATEHEVARHHQEDTRHDDACSPFCHCTCCAGFSVTHFTTTISACDQPDKKFFTNCLPDNTIEISLPVWQPPQLS